MSSVLKALKKLEDERRAAAPSSETMTPQRWASGGQPSRRSRPWLPVIAGVAGVLLLVLVLLWPGRNEAPVALAPSPEPGPVPVEVQRRVAPVTERNETPVAAASVQPVSVRPVVEDAVKPVARTVQSAPGAVVRPQPSSPPAAPSPSPRPVAVVPAARKPSAEVPVESTVRKVQINRRDIPDPGQQWVAPSQLTVNEIFPPTGGERMAIVNGLPVMVGTMVEEAMVEEIHDDRVVVSIDGKQVSLPLRSGR